MSKRIGWRRIRTSHDFDRGWSAEFRFHGSSWGVGHYPSEQEAVDALREWLKSEGIA